MAERVPSVNGWLEDELYQQYLYDKKTVDPGWAPLFESNGHDAAKVAPVHVPATAPAPTGPLPTAPGDQLVPLRGPALRIAENMTASLAIPVATSQRVMPVKVIDENRRTINSQRAAQG